MTTNTMPEHLKVIHDRVERLRLPASNLDALRPAWAAHTSRVREQVPDVHLEDEGEILFLGELSPGCRACKQGTWDCIFVTMHCNLDCAFCYSPHAISKNYLGSAFGNTPEQIAANYARTEITGVSFSGGEPFMQIGRLLDWATWFRERYPTKYYWVYTNGLLAEEKYTRELAARGLDEIRFNMAATGYDHPTVIAHLAAAARWIPNVTVEIPAIPEHAGKLFSSLALWAAIGVRFLNLHELMYEPGTNSALMGGTRQPIVTLDGHYSEINPHSRALTLAAMEHVQQEKLPLSVNDCSLQSKIRQLRGRRRSLAPLTKAPHEKLVRDEVYESYCAFCDDTSLYVHPEDIALWKERRDYRLVHIVRTAPLSLDDRGMWISFQELD